jgi:hypothetical protein
MAICSHAKSISVDCFMGIGCATRAGTQAVSKSESSARINIDPPWSVFHHAGSYALDERLLSSIRQFLKITEEQAEGRPTVNGLK